MIDTNLLEPIWTTKAFIPYFREEGHGLFINTASIGGLIAVAFNSMYHATKWALEGWNESMAFELNQVGIAMKIVEPGGMKTDFVTRPADIGRHPAYDALLDQVMVPSPHRRSSRPTQRRGRSPTLWTRPLLTMRTSCATSPAQTHRRPIRCGWNTAAKTSTP
jgi:short-subunit dehydrogenase